MFFKKKKGMEEKIDTNTKSLGELRLEKEIAEIEMNLKTTVPQACFIKKDELKKFEVEYTPDKSSFWYGGKYLFTFDYPDDYPDKPPKVLCKTKIYHPNIDYNGNVCLNMLKEDWTPIFNVNAVIAGVYYLFVVPNPNDPLNHDVAKIMRDDQNLFAENVKRTLRGGYQFGQDFPKFTNY